MYPYLDIRVTRQPITLGIILKMSIVLPCILLTRQKTITCHSICTYLSADTFVTIVPATLMLCRMKQLSTTILMHCTRR